MNGLCHWQPIQWCDVLQMQQPFVFRQLKKSLQADYMRQRLLNHVSSSAMLMGHGHVSLLGLIQYTKLSELVELRNASCDVFLFRDMASILLLSLSCRDLKA